MLQCVEITFNFPLYEQFMVDVKFVGSTAYTLKISFKNIEKLK